MTSAPTPPETPWYRKWWVWAIVAAVIVVGVIGQLTRGTTQAPAAETIPTASIAPSPTPTETFVTATPQPAVDDVARSAALEQAIKDALGVDDFATLAASDPTLWGGYINGVRVDGANAHVSLQVAASDPDRDDLGDRAAQALSTLLPASAVDGIDWIVVDDAAGVVIAQKRPAPIS